MIQSLPQVFNNVIREARYIYMNIEQTIVKVKIYGAENVKSGSQKISLEKSCIEKDEPDRKFLRGGEGKTF